MAGRREVLLLLRTLELDQRREEQDHVAALVHDGRPAVVAFDFAREFVLGGLGTAVVPAEVVVAFGEVDVAFLEDGRPLEGCSVKYLASRAMAKLSIQRPVPTQLELHPSTMTSSFIFRVESLSFIRFLPSLIMDLIGLAEFPIVLFAVDIGAVVTIGFGGFFFGFLWGRHRASYVGVFSGDLI